MNDKKIDEDFNEGFNDDFNFGEEEFQAESVQKQSGGRGTPPNKSILGIVGVIIIGLIGYFGFRFYGSQKTEQTSKTVKLAPTEKPITTAELPTSPVKPKPPTTAPATTAPATTTSTTTTTVTAAATKTPTDTPKTEETSFAQEFTKTEETLTQTTAPKASEPPPQTNVANKTTVQENSIETLHNELFVSTDNKAKETKEAKKDNAPPVNEKQLNQAMEVLGKLNQQMENNLSQIKYLEAYTREISGTVSKLNTSINAMDNRLLALTNTATLLSKDVGSVRHEVGNVRRAMADEGLDLNTVPIRQIQPKVDLCAIAEAEFVVHAVIPGRAWLKNLKGQILTVTEGDVIGNYGKVLVIDPTNGVVLTNSGITFR